MIHPDSFTAAWVQAKAKESRNADPILVEKVIRALALLEGLAQSGLSFVFKGGTALMLLLEQTKRLSIDIDIIIPQKPAGLEELLQLIVQQTAFVRLEAQHRPATSQIEKAHYKFYYHPVTNTRGNEEYILLDILFEHNPYELTQATPVQSLFLQQEGVPVTVQTPTVEAILGDKLTAFAPTTTGILYGKGKEMEIIKQLFDIGNLFEVVTDLEVVRKTFYRIAHTELDYRCLEGMTPAEVLEDIHQTALCLSLRGASGKGDFNELQRGVQNIRNFIYSDSYQTEKAIVHAARAAYLVSLIRSNAQRIERLTDVASLKDAVIEPPFNTKLNKLKKSNLEAFFYWFQVFKMNK
jgi:hypothetical protein